MIKGKIFVISGPSGAGKGTIIRELLKKPELNLIWGKTYTTRPKRPSDDIENHYFFVSEEKFFELIKKGDILEHEFVHNWHYGSPKSWLENNLEKNKTILLELDVRGALTIKKRYPETITIFISYENLDLLDKRLASDLNRRGISEGEIKTRLGTAKKEMTYIDRFDHVVVNPEGQPEKAVEQVEKIITSNTR